MWFAQDSGFALGALPLGLGLPRRAVVTMPAQRALAEHSLAPYVGSPARPEDDTRTIPNGRRDSARRDPLSRRDGAGRARGAAGPRSCRRSRSTAGRPPRSRACTRGCTAAACPRPGRTWASTA